MISNLIAIDKTGQLVFFFNVEKSRFSIHKNYVYTHAQGRLLSTHMQITACREGGGACLVTRMLGQLGHSDMH